MRREVVLVLTLLTGLSAAACPTFSCATLAKGQCIAVAGNATNPQVQVMSCTDYEYCPVVQSGTSACVSDESPLMYPGDFCSTNDQCSSNMCQSSGVCSGKALNQSCSAVYDCAPGLACDAQTLKCVAQGAKGSGCQTTFECANNMTCILGFCLPYQSLPNGMPTDQVENMQVGLALSCASGFAAPEGIAWVCRDAPVSSGTLPVQCEVGAPNQCADKSGSYNSACLCGYNQNGDSYCSLFPGDDYGVWMLGNFSSLLGVNGKCNTYSRFSFNCFAREDMRDHLGSYYSYAQYYALLTSNAYPLTVENSPCVQEVFTSAYWELIEAQKQYDEYLCPRYECAPSTAGWEQDQCVSFQNQTFGYLELDMMILSPCTDNTTQCQATQMSNGTCELIDPPGYPGDYCTAASECVTNICSNDVCGGGAELGANCTHIYECNPGLFCNFTSRTCEKQAEENMACSDSLECVNYLGCNKGICVKYFSLPVGFQTDSIDSSGFAELCQTGFANITSKASAVPLTGVCAAAPESMTYPQQCVAGNACFSTNGGYQKECICGYNAQGSSYCPLFEGDLPMREAISNFGYLMQYNLNCNTISRKGERCFQLTPPSLEYFYYYALNLTYFQLYPLIQGSEDCALNIYAAEYVTLLQHQAHNPYNPHDHDDNSTAFSLLPPALFSLISTFT